MEATMDIKPNRKTWIIGTTGGGPIKLPPVVPMMTTQTRDELIALFAAHLAQVPDTSELKRQIANLKKPFLSPVEMRRLTHFEKQLAEAQTGKEKAEREAESRARSYALNLCLARGITSVRAAGRCLGFTTAPIAIGKVILGCYDVLIDLTQSVPKYAILVRQHWYRGDQGAHPHWSSGGPCFGYAGPFLEKLLRAKHWPEAVGVLLTYLGTYNGGSPLIRLNHFARSGDMYYNPRSALPDDSRPNWWDWKPAQLGHQPEREADRDIPF
jgi:hypothetical protein